MLKFISSAVLAASVIGVSLRDHHDDPANSGPPHDGPGYKERVERIHTTLDVNGDDVIDIVEASNFVYIAEESGYISHDKAALFAYFVLRIHHEKGTEVTLKEMYDFVADIVKDSEYRAFALKVIGECLDLAEWIIFAHGTVKTFFEADTDDDYYLSKAELADAGLVRYLKKFDEDNNGALDFSEYAEAVLTDADKYDEYYEDKVDEFAYQMQETGDLNMGSDELDSWYEDPGN